MEEIPDEQGLNPFEERVTAPAESKRICETGGILEEKMPVKPFREGITKTLLCRFRYHIAVMENRIQVIRKITGEKLINLLLLPIIGSMHIKIKSCYLRVGP